MSNQNYLNENKFELDRLISLVARLDDAALAKRVGKSWTVGALFGHLAFWDDMAARRLRQWKETGNPPPSVMSIYHLINDSMLELLNCCDLRFLADLAVRNARATDSLVENLDAEFISTVENSDQARLLQRHAHRKMHLDKIEEALV